jgi:predicted nucleotidyltransferase
MAASTDGDRAPLLAAVRVPLAGVRFAYVFGSVLTEAFNAESDVDVAVDCGRRLGFEEVDDLRRRCAEATGRDVDLVDLFAADPIIRMQVLRYGETIVVNDRVALAVFAMRAVSEYLDFKIDRRGIEAAMREPHATGR